MTPLKSGWYVSYVQADAAVYKAMAWRPQSKGLMLRTSIDVMQFLASPCTLRQTADTADFNAEAGSACLLHADWLHSIHRKPQRAPPQSVSRIAAAALEKLQVIPVLHLHLITVITGLITWASSGAELSNSVQRLELRLYWQGLGRAFLVVQGARFHTDTCMYMSRPCHPADRLLAVSLAFFWPSGPQCRVLVARIHTANVRPWSIRSHQLQCW